MDYVKFNAQSDVKDSVNAFILNNYGFMEGTDEYDCILYVIIGIMHSYGFVDKDGDVNAMSFVNFLSYPQFQSELKDNLTRMMEWLVEMGGEKLDLFVNCE